MKRDKVPSLYLPVLFTSRIPTNERKPPRSRLLAIQFPSDPSPDSSTVIDIVHVVDVCTQTEENFDEIKVELASAREKILFLEQKLKKMNNEELTLNNIKYDDYKVTFFKGYPNYEVLEA